MRALAMLLIGMATILTGSLAMADLKTEEMIYPGGGVDMHGYIAWDDSVEGERPGIVVVHEWWGQNDYPRKRAEMLAELGYTALAIDMYGDGKTARHPDDAGAFAAAVGQNMEDGRARFNAGLELLKGHPTVDPEKIGAIGYCFGGGIVLHMARSGTDLDVVASFHGSLDMLDAPGPETIATRVVAYNGQADPFVTAEQIEQFETVMEATGAGWQLIQLPGAVHGFSNPDATANGEKFDLPLAYSKLADEASWAHMQLLFEDTFGD